MARKLLYLAINRGVHQTVNYQNTADMSPASPVSDVALLQRFDLSLSHTLFNIAKITLQCRNEQVNTLESMIMAETAKVSQKCKVNIDEFLAEVKDLISRIEHSAYQPSRMGAFPVRQKTS